MSTNCEQISPLLDAYLDNEVTRDASPAVDAHLRACSRCSRELEIRRTIRGRLQNAVRGETGTEQLQAAIRQSIERSQPLPKSSMHYRVYIPIAAALIICLSGAIAYHFGYLRLTRRSQDAYFASISAQIPGILRVGLGDHVHCAVYKAYGNQHPSLEQMAQDLGPYKDLPSLVSQKVEAGYRVEMAHECRYRGRHFVHVTLRNGSTLVSLVISRRDRGESFEKDELVPALTESGIPIYQAAVQRFEVTGFESGDYLVYVISNLGRQDNLRMIATLGPSVIQFLQSVNS